MIKFYKKVLTRFEDTSPEAADWINIEPPFDHNELEILASQYFIPLDLLTDSLDIDERE